MFKEYFYYIKLSPTDLVHLLLLTSVLVLSLIYKTKSNQLQHLPRQQDNITLK